MVYVVSNFGDIFSNVFHAEPKMETIKPGGSWSERSGSRLSAIRTGGWGVESVSLKRKCTLLISQMH